MDVKSVFPTVKNMNKKERVAAAIARKPVDRTVYNFRAEPDTLEKIYQYLGFNDYDKLLDRIGTDIISVSADFPPEREMDGFYQNFWGERYVYLQTQYGPVRQDLEGALASAATLSEIESFKWPKNDDVDYSRLIQQIERHPDMAVQYGFADIWQRPYLVRGMGNFMMDMALNPDNCHYLSNIFADFYEEDYRRAQKAAQGKIQIFNLYSDIGSQKAPLISREMLREFVLPYIRRIADVVHALNGALFFHTCGMIYPFINDLADSGVDILDPIQPCTPEMQPDSLAAAFGDRICFHGGIDVQKVLVEGTAQDVRDAVKRYKDCFSSCGYICSSTHLLQSDASVENMLAIFEEIMEDV